VKKHKVFKHFAVYILWKKFGVLRQPGCITEVTIKEGSTV